MNSNLVKILVNGKIIEANIHEDDHFLGGKKAIYKNENKTTSIVSINLVNIVNDELSGSTRD